MHAAAEYAAARLRVGSSDDFNLMVAMRLVGIVGVVRLFMIVEDVLDFTEGLFADRRKLLDAFGGSYFSDGRHHDGVDQLAEAIHRAEHARKRERRDERGLQRLERFVAIIGCAEMRNKLHVARHKERVRPVAFHGHFVAVRIGDAVDHIAHSGNRHHSGARSYAVQATIQKLASGVAVFVDAIDAEHYARLLGAVFRRDIDSAFARIGRIDRIRKRKRITYHARAIARANIPAKEVRVARHSGKLYGLARIAIARKRRGVHVGIRFGSIGCLRRVHAHREIFQREARLEAHAGLRRELIRRAFGKQLSCGLVVPAHKRNVIVEHAERRSVERHAPIFAGLERT